LSAPPPRQGRPKCRAICPVQSTPIPDSGVPNEGEPDCMSVGSCEVLVIVTVRHPTGKLTAAILP
jgi:hypothetical protein